MAMFGVESASRSCMERPVASPASTICSGVLTAAPLQIFEAGEATGLSIHDREALATPNIAIELLGQAQHHLDRSVAMGAGG